MEALTLDGQCAIFNQDIEETGVFMEPGIWGGLPEELLHEVCARLPVPQIYQLQLLSKEWKTAIDTRSGHIRHYLEEKVYPNMFGLVSPVIDREENWGIYAGRLFDVKSDRWHDFVLESRVTRGMRLVGAADGGLICLVNERTDEIPVLITVLNPLTKKSVKLPCLLGSVDSVQRSDKPTMIQICMDSERQHYNVLVVGYTPSPQVYSSKNKGWTFVGVEHQSWDRIFGYEYRWRLHVTANPRALPDYKPAYAGHRHRACVYEFGKRRGQNFRIPGVMSYTNSKNCLFLLQMCEALADTAANLDPAHNSGLQPNTYCISEYRLEKNAHKRVKKETHNCCPFDDCSDRNSIKQIHACNGYLMLFAHAHGVIAPANQPQAWLYNLSSHEWRKLPELMDHMRRDTYRTLFKDSLMCELRWDAVP